MPPYSCMKFIFIFFLLLSPLTYLSAHALGAYDVENVVIELEGDNPEELRAEALKHGQDDALKILLRKITPESDWGRHPWILADEQASRYIQRVAIVDEKGADGAYSVTFNVSFDPVKTRRMLLKHKVNFSEAQNNNLLLIPVWVSNGSARVIGNNAWLDALKLSGATQRSVLSIDYLQNIDLTAASKLKVNDLIRNDKALTQLAKTYPEQQVGVSIAEVAEVEGKQRLTVTTSFADSKQTPIAFSLPIKQTPEKILPRAARQLLERAQNQLVQKDIIRADQEQVLFVRYKAGRVQDIERMQTALGNISVVANVSPRLISAAESVFMVHMYSDVPAFLRAAERAGLQAEKQGTLYQVNFR